MMSRIALSTAGPRDLAALRASLSVVPRVALLLVDCEAVAFAVPPDVQAAMATEAARAGKALLLDKPIGLTLPEAEALTAAVDAAGVVSQLVLSNRYRPRVREFLAAAADFRTTGAQARQLRRYGSGRIN